MVTNYEDEVDAYYAAKEIYTEYLHKAAFELSQEAGSPINHATAEEKKDCDSWLLQGQNETAALTQLAKELADLMNNTETPENEPEDSESKAKSKGTKK